MLLFTYYFFILFSIIGYGHFIKKNVLDIKTNNTGYIGFIGIFFIITYSYLSSVLFPHSKIHNFIFHTLGIIFFVYELLIKKNYEKKSIFLLIFIFLILFIFILVGKNHDDFNYYHFQYTYLLTEHSHPVGIGYLNHGFRTPSSIFFFSSLLYLPKIDHFLFHITPIFFLGFANFILIKKIFDFKIFNKVRFISFLSLAALTFINILFYRIAEHGTDRSAQILIFLIIIDILYILNNKILFSQVKNKIFIITIMIFICVSLKAFYLIYLIFLVPLAFYIKDSKKIFDLILSKTGIFCTILLTSIFFINLINTGCIIYPASFTCFTDFSWSIKLEEIQRMHLHYQNWSKAGSGAGYQVLDQEKYLANFNWVINWFDKYFFTKVSDFILSVLLITIILTFTFFKKSKHMKYKRKLGLIYVLLSFLLIEWFINHPSLRYGGYHLIGLLFFIPFSLFLEKYKLSKETYLFKSKIIVLIICTIAIGRNVDRLSNEYNQHNYNLLKSTNYSINDDYFIINNKISELINCVKLSTKNNQICENDNFIVTKKLNKIIFLNK